METMVKKLYEGMFLVDSAEAASDWEGVLEAITTILSRAEAEVVSIKKWDERKLAYDIDGKSRGTYILSYFRAEGSKISGMERDVQLNERIMRALILNAEHMTQADMDKATPAELVERGEVTREEDKDGRPERGGEEHRRATARSAAIDVIEVDAEPEEPAAMADEEVEKEEDDSGVDKDEEIL